MKPIGNLILCVKDFVLRHSLLLIKRNMFYIENPSPRNHGYAIIEAVEKRHKNMIKIIFVDLIRDSIAAGMLIGFGCIANVSCENNVVGALLFSIGLLAVIIQNRFLFTGKVGYWTKFRHQTIELFIGLFFNLISIWLTCFVFSEFSGLPLDCGGLIQQKMNEGSVEALVRAIGCGAMMYIAVDGYHETSNPIVVIIPVMTFILCGFDHCIANFGYMGMYGNLFVQQQLFCWIAGNSIGSLMISRL